MSTTPALPPPASGPAVRRRVLMRWVRPLAMIAVVLGLGLRGGAGPRPAGHGAGLLVGLSLLGVVAGSAFLLRSDRRRAAGPVAADPQVADPQVADPPTVGPPVVDLRVVDLLATVAVLASSGALVWFEPNGSGFLGGYVAAGAAGARMPGRVGAAVAAGVAVVLGVAGLAGADRPALSILVPGCGLLAFYSAGRYARRLRDRTEQAERLLADLAQTREAQTRAAALAERHRLAREMHDVLAHSLSGLLVQLEAARLLASRGVADPRLAETVERAHHLAGAGLREARRAIGMLRDDELPGPERLPALAEEFERDTGVRCRLATSGTPRRLGPQARLTLYRVAQEALTNVRRHADSQRVDLRLDYRSDGARLSVEDSGSAPAPHPGTATETTTTAPATGPASSTGGYGLTGMRERAELLGGTLTANPTAAGFRVEVWIPG